MRPKWTEDQVKIEGDSIIKISKVLNGEVEKTTDLGKTGENINQCGQTRIHCMSLSENTFILAGSCSILCHMNILYEINLSDLFF